MNTVDLIVLIVGLFYFIRGWMKGFLRTIFGPISLIIGSIVSYLYFKQSGNVFVSILIGLILPFILNFGLSLLINIWRKATDEDDDFFTIGRLLGGIFSFIWGVSLATLIVLLIVLTPLQISWLKSLQHQIKQSQYYSLLDRYFTLEKTNDQIGLNTLQEILNDPVKIQRFQETQTFRELVNDEKLKNIFSDQETLNNLKNNNIGALLKNPEFVKLISDEEFRTKILSAYQEILKMEKTGNNGTFAPNNPK